MKLQDWEAALEADRLTLTSPEGVYAYLAALPPSGSDLDKIPHPTIVSALWKRADPLITLGLARYASDRRLLELLWAMENPALRLAVLANRGCGPVVYDWQWPRFIERMNELELAALYGNPKIPAAVLEATFDNTLGLSEQRHFEACALAVRNERLTFQLGAETKDQMLESITHDRPIGAVWDLFLNAPTIREWAGVLMMAGRVVFDVRVPPSFMPDAREELQPDERREAAPGREDEYLNIIITRVRQRWHAPDGEDDGPDSLWTLARAAFACALSRKKLGVAPFDFSDSDDVGFRMGFYGGAPIHDDWPLDAYLERDRRCFLDEIIRNDSLYETHNLRQRAQVRSLVRRLCVNAEDTRLWTMRRQIERLSKADAGLYSSEPL